MNKIPSKKDIPQAVLISEPKKKRIKNLITSESNNFKKQDKKYFKFLSEKKKNKKKIPLSKEEIINDFEQFKKNSLHGRRKKIT